MNHVKTRKNQTVPSDSEMYHLLEHDWRFEEYRRANARCVDHSEGDVCCDVLTGRNNVMFWTACPGVYIPGKTPSPFLPLQAKRGKMSLNSHFAARQRPFGPRKGRGTLRPRAIVPFAGIGAATTVTPSSDRDVATAWVSGRTCKSPSVNTM